MDRKEKSSSAHQSSTIMNLPETKCIQVFVNGDEHFPGCRCVVNYRYYRNIDMFLNFLTERLKPSFGAIRNIYTPVNGHPVVSLEELINKHRYVVAGNERFKKLDFGYSSNGDKVFKKTEKKSENVSKTSKARSDRVKSLNVRLHKNGLFKVKSTFVTLGPQDLVNWEMAYKKITNIINCGPIKRLCSVDGKPLRSIHDLANHQTYVIVGKHEVFKFGPYGTQAQHNISSKNQIKSSVIPETAPAVKYSKSAQSTHEARKRLSNEFQVVSPNVSPGTFFISGPGNGVESDASCPSTFETSRIKIDLDDDFSGIFRSKVQNHLTAGAQEIEDSVETVVDVPVDLLDAEEVEDEITPDVERSLQQLSLEVPDKIIAYLPNGEKQNSQERNMPPSKYNLSQSHSLDAPNILV